MSVRIRYQKNAENVNVLDSVRHFMNVGSSKTYKVSLDTGSMKFTVMNALDGQVVVEGGDTSNLAVLKIQAKKALVELGVSFKEEKRDRDFFTES